MNRGRVFWEPVRFWLRAGIWLGAMALAAGLNGADKLPRIAPEKAGFDSARLRQVDALIEKAIQENKLPGAVLLIGRGRQVVYHRAFGWRNRVGTEEKMTEDTIFDLASLTKPVATAASVWKLVENGQLRLWDRVSLFVPAFASCDGLPPGGDESPLRLYHLLTHTSGLPPYLDVAELRKKQPDWNPEQLSGEIAVAKRLNEPGGAFHYSCLNFILLGHIVHLVSGQDLACFATENLFRPLAMEHTFFQPPEKFRPLVAPTEMVDGQLLRGVVHDPLARLIGGISGNAGLFSTADDLSHLATMLLDHGLFRGRRIFSPLTVRAFTTLYPPFSSLGRTPGWDLATDYSSPRGDLLPIGSFGHTGFTGTSIWIDPKSGLFIIFLANSVHPDGRGDILRLRGQIANVVAASLVRTR